MKFALREMRRRPSRFVTAVVILTLIASLVLLLGGLVDGLIAQATGAIRAQRAELIVYSSTARDVFLRSRVTPATKHAVEQVAGVRSVAGLGETQLGARIPGRGARDLANVALFGIERTPNGVPRIPPVGAAYADSSLKAKGVRRGTTIALGPARSPIRVVGFVDDTSYSGQSSLWASPATWRSVLLANRPAETLATGVFQVLVVSVSGNAARVASVIDRATNGSTHTLTLAAAADAIPGVKQQRDVFNQIIGVTLVVAIVVIALFFALLTVERTALYGVLKALGARSRALFTGLVVQSLVVTAVASAIACALAVGLDLGIPPGTIPFALTPARVVSSTALLFVASIIGCVFSLRRVLRVDPAAVIGSGS